MFELMAFMFFFFLGIICLFWALFKKMDTQTRTLADEHAQMRVLLRAMESRLDKITQFEKINAMFQGNMGAEAALPGENAAETDAAHDPLLHLSFDQPHPAKNTINPGLDLRAEPGLDLSSLPLAAKKD